MSLERGVLVADVVCVTESRQRHRDEVIFTTQGCTFNITEVKSVRKVCVGTRTALILKKKATGLLLSSSVLKQLAFKVFNH